MDRIHLVCNAHLDPVWLWEWEEGAAEALSTFRTAADFCRAYDGFVFNHNEAVLYRWVEEFDPTLFRRIQDLVAEGKWHIMGGWHLQPDCNMPCGESFVRQILTGRIYFREKFGVEPRTAINFDPFGHTRGLVQIMSKAGYNSYVFFRPLPEEMPLASPDFIWVGFDGSEILAHRSDEGYNSILGRVAEKLNKWLRGRKPGQLGLFLWGIGDHGGGPSRADLDSIRAIMDASTAQTIVHSTLEAYFADLNARRDSLPRRPADLNPHAQGCYTSQIRVKQTHRALENQYYLAEKMLSSAAVQGRLTYPAAEMEAALLDLLTAEFHDALPGSSIQPVEEATLRLLAHGLEITSRMRAKAFFTLADGQEKVKDGETAILVYNPHPFNIKCICECEFVLPAQNWEDEFTYPLMCQGGRRVACQAEKEASSFSMDWRKRAVFLAELAPSQMNRFDCRFEALPRKPPPSLQAQRGRFVFETEDLLVDVNCGTGLVDRYRVRGHEYLQEGSFQSCILQDSDNSWGETGFDRRKILGAFALMDRETAAGFANLRGASLDSVRVIEDGAVRTVIEAVFACAESRICQTYKLPKLGTEIQVDLRVYWQEKGRMLKLFVPTRLAGAEYLGQTAYGAGELPADGEETVAQKWVAVVSPAQGKAFSCINNGTYGSSFSDGELRLTLLRSPGYATMDFLGRPAVPDDRFLPRMDQGERFFSFWFNGGDAGPRLEAVDREALARNETPFALPFCPSGEGDKPLALITLSDNAVQMTAFKKAERTNAYIIRLFEPTGRSRVTSVHIPPLGIKRDVSLRGFELKTLALDMAAKTLTEVDLLEKLT